MRLLRKYLIAGLLVWLPLAATFLIIKLLIDILNGILLLLPPQWHPETLIGFSIPGMGAITSILLLLLTGLLVANLFGRKLITLWEAILNRIPLVRTIYSTVKQVLEILFSANNKSFRHVVLIEYPRKGIWSMGFQTNNALPLASKTLDQDLVSVFIPTTPNPTSGFIVMIPKEDVVHIDITVEDGFKFIISMGVIATERSATDFSQESG